MNENQYKVAEVYTRLRNLILKTDPLKLAISIALENTVYGVVMEMGRTEGVATLVCMADGTVSIYLSGGGGFIGLGQHERIRTASDALIADAGEFIPMASKVEDYPLPQQGYMRFYFLTKDAIYTIEALDSDLKENKVPLSKLAYKGHEVLTEYRHLEQAEKSILGAASRGEEENIQKAFEYDNLLIHCKDRKLGVTPLMVATQQGHPKAVEKLVKLGAKIDEKDNSGYTALMIGCNVGKVECVKVLVNLGANVNEQDKEESTPIMFAAQHGYNEIVKILLQHNANPRQVGKHGFSAIGFAKQNKLAETEKILNSYN